MTVGKVSRLDGQEGRYHVVQVSLEPNRDLRNRNQVVIYSDLYFLISFFWLVGCQVIYIKSIFLFDQLSIDRRTGVQGGIGWLNQ